VYPRNSSSPPRIAIGQVLDEDGAIQTSGVSVKVIPQGGSETAGQGTVGYSADGVVLYTPTQAETDHEAFVMVARKDNCYAASVTVVTSPLSISDGKVAARYDWQADVTNKPTIGTSTLTTGDVTAAVASAISGMTGSGARTVVIAVRSGETPIDGARVRVTRGAESYLQTTSAQGTATFYLDDGPWAIAITKPLYSFGGASLLVSADATVTYSLTPVAIPPSEPGQVTGYTYCYDVDGSPEKDVTVHLRMTSPPPGVGAFDGSVYQRTSDAAGLVVFPGLFSGATYRIWRGQRGAILVTIPSGVATYALPAFVGW